MLRAGAMAISAVVLSLAGAGTATARTLVVDDDRKQCPSAPYRAIQAAVDAAGAGDKVSVCPGSYRGQVYIDTDQPGLVVESAKRRAATILSPRLLLAGSPPQEPKLRAIVVAAGVGSIVRGFRIIGPLAHNTQCGELGFFTHEAGVQIGAADVRIEDNHIRDIRDNCGNGQGIWAGDTQNELGLDFGAANAVIRGNLIEQYRHVGIVVESSVPEARVRILDNEIIGAQSRQTNGVVVGQEGAAEIVGNYIRSNRAFGVYAGGVFTGDHVVRHNRIRGNGIGVTIDGDVGSLVSDNDISASRSHGIVDDSGLGGGGSRILRNVVRDSGGHGLLLRASNLPGFQPFGTVTGNVVRHSRDGIRVEGYNYRLSDNKASVSRGLDCRDTSGPGGPGTAGTFNVWTGNRGRTDSPAAICRA